jgi:hypothetical protein
LATALIFATLAERHRKSARHEAANGTVADAENSLEELVRFLNAVRYSAFLGS